MNSLFAITAPIILVLMASFLTACGKKDDNSATTIQPYRSQIPTQPQQPQGPINPENQPNKPIPPQEDPNQPPTNDAQRCENGDEAACDNVDQPLTDNEDSQPLPPSISDEEIAALATQYTSAGGDGFRSHLTELMNQKMKSAIQKIRYYRTAKTILNVRAEVDGDNMNVRVERSGQQGTHFILLKGKLGYDSGIARLRKIKTVRSGKSAQGQISAAFQSAMIEDQIPGPVLPSKDSPKQNSPTPNSDANSHSEQQNAQSENKNGSQNKNSGQPPANLEHDEDSTALSGSAMCLDRDNSKCLVVLVNLRIGMLKTPVIAVVRRSSASFSLLHQNITNSNAHELMGYFANTSQRLLKSMKSIELTSSEVIHGRTEMKSVIIMQDNQMIAAKGPMLAPVETKFTNVTWEKDVDLRDLMGRDPRTGFRQDLQNKITGVRMTSNNGKGEITLAFATPADAQGGSPGEVSIIFTRSHPLVKYIDEIRAHAKKYRLNLDL